MVMSASLRLESAPLQRRVCVLAASAPGFDSATGSAQGGSLCGGLRFRAARVMSAACRRPAQVRCRTRRPRVPARRPRGAVLVELICALDRAARAASCGASGSAGVAQGRPRPDMMSSTVIAAPRPCSFCTCAQANSRAVVPVLRAATLRWCRNTQQHIGVPYRGRPPD